MTPRTRAASLALAALLATGALQAQQPAAPAGLAQRFAPIDLTGTWVSIVTEDWAVRMIPPPKGDFESLPLTPAARDAANRFDAVQAEAAGRACDAYGAPAALREPGRLRISWQDAATLKLETDSGQQTRLLHFEDAQRGAPGRQGYSAAEWQYAGGFDPIRAAQAAAAAAANPQAAGRGGAAGRAGGGNAGRGGGGFGGRGGGRGAPTGGKLKVTTTNLSAGLIRKNGVPYSANTTMTEYFNLLTEPGGTRWFVVTTVLHDPENLVVDYITSTNFRREADDTKWQPRPCSLK